MNPGVRDALARELLRQRAVLVDEVVDTEADLHTLAEDRAQEEREARLLIQFDDREKNDIVESDAALRRLAEGTYGTCEGCGESIAEARLQALPAARFCVACAQAQETQSPVTPEEAPIHPGPMPLDLSLLSDQELNTLIHKQVPGDGHADMDELRIVCRHGVVYLEGALPSEAEHNIVRQVITDVLGLEEIVDHVQVKEVLWEREERGKTKPP